MTEEDFVGMDLEQMLAKVESPKPSIFASNPWFAFHSLSLSLI